MSWLTRTLRSGTGRKALTAVTGLALVLFLVIHLIGNLQIFSPSNAFNEYAKMLHDGPLIVIGDIGLLITFPLHIGLVIWLAIDNKRARGDQRYAVTGTKQKRSFAQVLASKTTLYGGIILLVFVVVHLWDFRLAHDEIGYDVRGAVITKLAQPLYAGLYILGSLATGWHLSHGIQAAFRSLGFQHDRYSPLINKGAVGLSILLALGFASIPAWIVIAA